MSLWSNFCGGTYQALSPVIAADQAINVYGETRDVGQPVKQVTFYGTPGRRVLISGLAGAERGLFTQDGQTWGVFGGTVYAIDAVAALATALGTINDDGAPVSFASNGQGGDQLGIVGGGELKVIDLVTGTLSAAVALPFSGPVMMAFLDGYGLILQRDSPIVWYSALEDLTSWDALDFFVRSGTSDNLVGLIVSQDRVRVLGSQTTTLYYDSGDADNPFLPYPGTTVQVGLASPWLLGSYNDVAYWVAQSANGQRRVVRASDAQPQDISTPPIDLFLTTSATMDDGECLIYEQAGHPFVSVTLPSSTAEVQTYVYDVREDLWHARAGWNSTTGVYTRWMARGATTTQGTVLVGDAVTAVLYVLDLDTYTDAGGVLKRERTAPYLAAEAEWLFVDQLELGMQSGVGLTTGQGSAPVADLEISRDGARTWIAAGAATLGAIGDYTARAIWRRLGRVRSDRFVARVTQTDPVKTVWGPGLWLRVTAGTGQL